MQLSPRYGPEPLIQLAGFPPAAIREPALRQRRRLATMLPALSEEQWMQPSRCAGWSARDVVVHLASTNKFWTHSIKAGLRGEPTQFLANFDPAATPAQLVAAERDVPTADVLERYVESAEVLAGVLDSVPQGQWSALAEAPPGHLAIATLIHHALWDAWVHERDIMVPLGMVPATEPDEVTACLRYVVALAPAFSVTLGDTRSGVMEVEATDPACVLAVTAGDHVEVRPGPAQSPDLRLAGDAVDLVEMLSVRKPLDVAVPEQSAWLVDGLASAFDIQA